MTAGIDHTREVAILRAAAADIDQIIKAAARGERTPHPAQHLARWADRLEQLSTSEERP